MRRTVGTASRNAGSDDSTTCDVASALDSNLMSKLGAAHRALSASGYADS